MTEAVLLLLVLGVCVYNAYVVTKLALGVQGAADDVNRTVGAVGQIFR